jgi:hypothetical protein
MGWRTNGVAALGAGLACLVLLAPRVAAAQSSLDPNVISQYGEIETPRSAGMGGALRALGTGSTGIFMNPAAIASTAAFHIDALTQLAVETRRWVLGAAVSDSITSKLAGALAINGTPISMDPNGIARSTLSVRLGLAFPITDRFILGITGRYENDKQSGEAPPNYGFCQSLVSGGLVDTSSGAFPQGNGKCPGGTGTNTQGRESLINTATLDFGLLIKPTDQLAIAFVGQNLTYANNGFLPMIAAGGIGYGTDVFAIEVDGLADFSSWGIPGAEKPKARIMAGGEYKAAGVVPIRAGYRFDQGASLSTLSVGSGYVGSEFAIEVSGSRSISNPGVTSIFFSASYFLESTGITRGSGVSNGVSSGGLQ